ncbi:hypothetical protein CPC08DRAFT_690172 [Agrocybe pediades]|nr:hypothetical protein CPC08DRAFT_690172 [Agrocybe pediades]
MLIIRFTSKLGACGHNNKETDLVVALSSIKYANGSHCGKNVKVHYKGKSVTVKIVDKCPGCSMNSIDLSPAAFKHLADESLGRIQVTWEFA